MVLVEISEAEADHSLAGARKLVEILSNEVAATLADVFNKPAASLTDWESVNHDAECAVQEISETADNNSSNGQDLVHKAESVSTATTLLPTSTTIATLMLAIPTTATSTISEQL